MLVHSAAWVGKDSTFSKLSEFPVGQEGKLVGATHGPRAKMLLTQFQLLLEIEKNSYDLLCNSFSVVLKDSNLTVHVGLINHQYLSALETMYRGPPLLDLYRSLDKSRYKNQVEHTLSWRCFLGALMSVSRLCFRWLSFMMDTTLRDMMKTETNAMIPDIKNLFTAKMCNICHWTRHRAVHSKIHFVVQLWPRVVPESNSTAMLLTAMISHGKKKLLPCCQFQGPTFYCTEQLSSNVLSKALSNSPKH